MINHIQVAAALGDATKKLPLFEIAVLVEVAEALFAADARLPLHEPLVKLVLESLVPEDDVVGAGEVLDVVRALASAADGVADFPLLSFVVGQVVEEKLGAVVPVAVVEVLEVDHVLVLDAPRVLGVPAAQDEGRSQDLVAELTEVHLAVAVVNPGQKNLLDDVSRHRLGAFALVVAPSFLLLESLQYVEDGGVVLAVMFVERGLGVVGEDVVDEAAPLRHVRFRSVLPALDEKFLHVLVGDVLLRRHEFLPRWGPVEFVALGELPCVQ